MATNTETQSPPGAAPEADQPKRLGKYVIQRRLGAGGMGTVFLALDSKLNRTVALKVLPKQRAANATLVKRFTSEGQNAARLEHDNIVKVFDTGEIDGHLYLALEYVDGIDVQDLVQKRGVVPVRRSIEIIRQVASALQHACERNIVHRDIKPSNLMIRKDGLVKLADMGLARAIDETAETSITRDGMTVGTVDYMAPEQARDSKLADIRSDIYSLGCTWYFMLTGSPPFPEGSVTSKLQEHATRPLPDPRQKNDRVPEALAAVIQRMTAKRPIDRYQTPAELIDELKQAHLSRANLDADVLAALSTAAAETGEEPVAESSDTTAAHDEPLPQKMKIKPGRTERRPAAANNVEREESAPAEVEPLPQKMKIRKRRTGSDVAGDRSAAKGRSGPSAGPRSQTSGQPRELPPRSENPAALGVSQRRLDPELLKFGFFGLLGVVILGSIAWAVVQMTSWSAEDAGRGGGINPFQARIDAAAAQHGPVPLNVVPKGPPESEVPEEDHTPAASIVAPSERQSAPFPGVEDVGANPGIEDVPEWVYAERAAGYAGLKQYTVSPAGSAGSFATVEEALAKMDRSGGVIEFTGRGPYPIPTLEIKDRERIVLSGAGGNAPVLVFTGGGAGALAGITMRGGRLELNGLHLVAAGQDFAADAALLAADASTLIVRDCSLTLADPAPRPVAAVSLSGSRPAASRCILENVLVRGNNLSAAVLSGSGQQFVAGNFLFASGDAPAVVISRAAELAAKQTGEAMPTRVELLAGAVFSRQGVLELTHAPGLESPSVSLRARRTAFLATGGAGTWMQLDRWPEGAVNDLERPRAKGIEWRADAVFWFGWRQLVRMTGPAGTETASAASDTEWRQFWRDAADSRAFGGPVEGLSGIDLSRAGPALVEAPLEAALAAAGEPEGDVGFVPTELPRVPESLLDRARAVAGRPRFPPGFGDKRPGITKEFDLSKGQGLTLNAFVESSECPDGTCIVLKGTGMAQIKPFRIENKSIRMEFQSDTGRLIVEPVQTAAGERAEALIQVVGGRVELVGGHLRIPSSDSRKYPLRVLQVVDGSFAVQNCILQGQIGAGAQEVAAIDWRQTSAAESTQFGLVSNSLLIGNTAALAAELSGRLLELRNSIVASINNGISVRASGHDGHLVVSDSTLSASRAFFQVETEGAASARLHVYVDNTVFGPSTGAAGEGPCILTFPAGAEANGRIDWWEERTAYDRRITRYRGIEGQPADGPQDFTTTWIRAWGTDHVLDALTGPTAVVLAAALPAPEKALPEDFALAAACGAAQSRIGGGAIGPRIERIGPNGLSAPVQGVQQRQPPKSTAPRSTDPDF
jgi:serine/threonine-protein kinase